MVFKSFFLVSPFCFPQPSQCAPSSLVPQLSLGVSHLVRHAERKYSLAPSQDTLVDGCVAP